ncbi:hypothetical protein [Pontiella agarivorans]|uniref:Uncharacterized protein n=1 Tax=Pontiella agarivorans TaxID=3038953 RepID=A0ABU5MSZ2_9BACT|nr:hypothetical protein [Pontiella agarivorans]MDZ8117320.1 hypothetical protein [Pontiella agarivorans]
MKRWSWLVFGLLSVSVRAGTIVLHNGGSEVHTTGDQIDEADHHGLSTNVVEIAGLNLFIQSGATNQNVNALASSMGIDSDGGADDTDRFEFGEHMIFSFDQKVEITKLDMVGFESNSTFIVDVDGQAPFSITYEDLENKTSQFFTTNIVVEAHTDILVSVGNTNSVIGLQSIDLDVLEGSGNLFLRLETSNDWINIAAEFDGPVTTNYVLQSSTNLASNVWNGVSTSFRSDTNWSFNTTRSTEYFRVIEQ